MSRAVAASSTFHRDSSTLRALVDQRLAEAQKPVAPGVLAQARLARAQNDQVCVEFPAAVFGVSADGRDGEAAVVDLLPPAGLFERVGQRVLRQDQGGKARDTLVNLTVGGEV